MISIKIKAFSSVVFLLVTIGFAMKCSTRQGGEPEIQTLSENEDVTAYEGQVVFDTSKYLHLDIQLQRKKDTEGSFLLTEIVIDQEKDTETIRWKGFYRLYPGVNGQTILVLENTSRKIPLRRTSLTQGGRVREENFRNTDLTFTVYDDRLQLLDQDMVVCSDPECFFYQRTSPLFTVEGYFMYRGDTSYFYEMNTRTRWPLMRIGSYYQAAREHNTLADKKNDTTYLKATAYSIRLPAKSDEAMDVLVLRKIIQSSSL